MTKEQEQVIRYRVYLDLLSGILLGGELDGYSKSAAERIRKELKDDGYRCQYSAGAWELNDLPVLESEDTTGGE